MTMGVAASDVSGAMRDGGGYSPRALCSFRLLHGLAAKVVSEGQWQWRGCSPFPVALPRLWYGRSTWSSADLLPRWRAAWVTWQ